MRWVVVLTSLGVLAFCGVGFLATFEPLERGSQLLWRSLYVAGIAASMTTLAFALSRRGSGAPPDGE